MVEGTDTVALTSELSASTVPIQVYLPITTDLGLPLNGTFGLAHDPRSLLLSLYTSNAIPKPSFSLFLTGLGGTVVLDFGTTDEGKYATEDLTYVEYADHPFWAVPATVSFDGVEISDGTVTAVFGVQKTMIEIPARQLAIVQTAICTVEAACKVVDSVVTFQCSNRSRFPDFEIRTKGKTMTVGGTAYVLKDGNLCYLLVRQGIGNNVYLGWPFFLSYYVDFDESRKAIGFAESVNKRNSGVRWGYWLLGVGVALVGVVAVGVGCFVWNRRRREEQGALTEQLLVKS